MLRQGIFGSIQQEELRDAITSLWKHRYLQRLDPGSFSKDQCVALIEQALGGPVAGLSAVDPPRSAAIIGGYHPSCSKRTEDLGDSSFLRHSKIHASSLPGLTRVEVPLFESVAVEARCPPAAVADRGGIGNAAV